MQNIIKIGTRRSKLAVWQAQHVANKLTGIRPDLRTQLVEIVTTGDRLYDANLALIGGKGLFLKEIEEQLLAGEIDIAVHSMKDVPAMLHDELVIAAILEREDPRDALLGPVHFTALPKGAVIGTCSTRRTAQLSLLRPDLNIVPLRGNIDTRIAKMEEGKVDAIVLALAGLKRLSLDHLVRDVFAVSDMIPAIAQGALGVECRANDDSMIGLVKDLNHIESYQCVLAERIFLRELSGDCTTPIGGYAYKTDHCMEMCAFYAPNISDTAYFAKTLVFSTESDPVELGYAAVESVRSKLSNDII
jgi:hydroxymethylbilane synthase